MPKYEGDVPPPPPPDIFAVQYHTKTDSSVLTAYVSFLLLLLTQLKASHILCRVRSCPDIS